MKQTGRVALITGGGRGIGFGISRSLAETGFDIAFCGVRPAEAVTEATEALRRVGARVCYYRADISQREERVRLIKGVRDDLGRLDLLVNNAGIPPRERKDILEASEASFEEVLRTNLQGPYFLTQAAARWMIEQKKQDENFVGQIVFVTSISAEVASVNRGEYCMSKAGLSMAARLWAVRLAEFGIPVYEVRPGIIATDMTAGVKQKYDELIAEGLLLQNRWGVPEDVGKMVAALAEGRFPYSTGQIFLADGGMMVPRL
jgi:3-oxoacyl-[acyl-carrier protein] reductase